MEYCRLSRTTGHVTRVRHARTAVRLVYDKAAYSVARVHHAAHTRSGSRHRAAVPRWILHLDGWQRLEHAWPHGADDVVKVHLRFWCCTSVILNGCMMEFGWIMNNIEYSITFSKKTSRHQHSLSHRYYCPIFVKSLS